MLLDQDKWDIYGQVAAEIVNNEHHEFIEAMRVLRLPFHKDVLGCLQHLEKSTVLMIFLRKYMVIKIGTQCVLMPADWDSKVYVVTTELCTTNLLEAVHD